MNRCHNHQHPVATHTEDGVDAVRVQEFDVQPGQRRLPPAAVGRWKMTTQTRSMGYLATEASSESHFLFLGLRRHLRKLLKVTARVRLTYAFALHFIFINIFLKSIKLQHGFTMIFCFLGGYGPFVPLCLPVPVRSTIWHAKYLTTELYGLRVPAALTD